MTSDRQQHVPMEPTIELAPLPTKRTLRMRQSIFVQAYKFAALNLRMGLLAMRSHK